MAKVFCVPDLHCPFQDDWAVDAAAKHCRDYAPDYLIFMGDVLNFEPLSRFTPSPYMQGLRHEIEITKSVVDLFRSSCPSNTSFIWLEGNHEYRLVKYLARQSGALASLNAHEYEGPLTVPSLMDLQSRHITYIPQSDVVNIDDVIFEHGDVTAGSSGQAAKKMVNKRIASVVMGHVHKLGSYYYRGMNRTMVGVETGHLANVNSRAFEYVKFPDWHKGYATIETEAGHIPTVALHSLENC